MRLCLVLGFPLALAACQPTPDDGGVEPNASETLSAEPGGWTGGTPAPAAAAPDTASTPAPPAIDGIPVALHGRWGMAAADCTSTRGDAKGLLTIAPTSLKFYESVGELVTIKDRTANSIHGDFAFTGEGMNWMRDETLSASGNTLTRAERGGDEPGSEEPFTYTRC
jgi:hypothetical protein